MQFILYYFYFLKLSSADENKVSLNYNKISKKDNLAEPAGQRNQI